MLSLTGYGFPPCCILMVRKSVGIIISSDTSVDFSASRSQNLSMGMPDCVSSSYSHTEEKYNMLDIDQQKH